MPVATKNMGWKLGYITSLDGSRVKDAAGLGLPEAVGTTVTASVVTEVGDELAEMAKVSEYDGG